jgi:hypothetical protein
MFKDKVVGYDSRHRASIADWFLGGDTDNKDRIDVTRVQMVLITSACSLLTEARYLRRSAILRRRKSYSRFRISGPADERPPAKAQGGFLVFQIGHDGLRRFAEQALHSELLREPRRPIASRISHLCIPP